MDYNGSVSVTRFGSVCAKWTDVMKRLPKFRKGYYPSASADHNFCRNPYGIFNEPKCYVLDNSMLVEKDCGVPICDGKN